MANNAGDAFDYVIVGSGAAGSVLAHRLTEQPGATVCVLEAGPPDRHPYIHVPAGFIKILFNPDFTWQFKTEPSEGSGGRPIPTTQGRTLGGSSSINGMIYNRGQRADLDSWAQRGMPVPTAPAMNASQIGWNQSMSVTGRLPSRPWIRSSAMPIRRSVRL